MNSGRDHESQTGQSARSGPGGAGIEALARERDWQTISVSQRERTVLVRLDRGHRANP
ncbi:MAG: hypothetical protein R3E83_21260 [Burkholderiaceae bacterium]